MSAVRFDSGEGLVETLPIFPLPGALLLPRGRLPLIIFEPRYLNMTLAALGQRRLIGMVQPRRPEPHPVRDDAPVYGVGCAGRITSFAETEDGRFLITLAGVSRFRIVRELERVAGYRRVEADYAPFAGDLGEEPAAQVDRARLLAAARGYFRLKGIEGDWKVIEAAPEEAIVTSLAMVCPFPPEEKQALLESPHLGERSRLLATLMEMAVCEAETPSTAARH